MFKSTTLYRILFIGLKLFGLACLFVPLTESASGQVVPFQPSFFTPTTQPSFVEVQASVCDPATSGPSNGLSWWFRRYAGQYEMQEKVLYPRMYHGNYYFRPRQPDWAR